MDGLNIPRQDFFKLGIFFLVLKQRQRHRLAKPFSVYPSLPDISLGTMKWTLDSTDSANSTYFLWRSLRGNVHNIA